MKIDQLLSDAAPDDREMHRHAERLRTDVLARAVAPRRDHRARWQRRATAGVAAAVATVGLGGVAYATNAVPDFVTSAVDGFAKDTGVAGSATPDMRQVVDLTLPDGSRFAAWQGSTPDMSCVGYTDNWNGVDVWNGGTACADAPVGAEQYLAWARSKGTSTYYPVLFGNALDGAASAHVTGTFSGTGESVDVTVPVDPATGVFSAVVPGSSHDPWGHDPMPSDLTVSFLDANGVVLSTVDGPII